MKLIDAIRVAPHGVDYRILFILSFRKNVKKTKKNSVKPSHRVEVYDSTKKFEKKTNKIEIINLNLLPNLRIV